MENLLAVHLVDLQRLSAVRGHPLRVQLDRAAFRLVVEHLRAEREKEATLRALILRDAPLPMMEALYGPLQGGFFRFNAARLRELGRAADDTARWRAPGGAVVARYHTGDETIGPRDQVVFEPGAALRHYHACMMYDVVGGAPRARHADMHRAACDAIDARREALRPGRTVGEVHDVHAATLGRAGFGHAALAVCGYTLVAAYPPTWMDRPMVWSRNPRVLEPGMVFFLHRSLCDRDTGLSMCVGETAMVTEGACERVTHVGRRRIVRG